MTEGHLAHLSASLLAAEDLLRQMERAGREGRSPASGQALAPLAPAEWQALDEPLTELRTRLEREVRRFAPRDTERRETAEGRGATLYWLSVLLRRLAEEIVDDLGADRMARKFGPLSEEERQAMLSLVQDLHAQTARMRETLESLRGGPAGSGPTGGTR